MKDGDMPKIIKEMCAECPEIGALACYLYDEIEARAKKSSNIALSYKDLFNIAGGYNKILQPETYEQVIYPAIQILCSPKVDFLKLNYWFIDDFHDPVELEIEEVIEAEISQSLANPFTGELMYDYKSFVFPFFTLDESKSKDII
ncbi:hypothetical protein E0S08_17335 [Salmonella enterica subsp. enterica serovar Onderstepoort]|nr:hypothetical protein [Salmonella enterica subsp. enterica serovar Onderstepoort]